jgi:uncharacterized protein (TIGR02118 family)
MIEVTVAYPAGQGRTFDMDYYLKTHIPLFQNRMGSAMKTIRVSRGIGGSTPRAPAAFVAMVHATFDSAEVFASAFAPHSAELQGDAPNYTNIQPVVQSSRPFAHIAKPRNRAMLTGGNYLARAIEPIQA